MCCPILVLIFTEDRETYNFAEEIDKMSCLLTCSWLNRSEN